MPGWDDLSPDVASILSDGQQRKEERKLSPAAKKEKARQRARVRGTYDIPLWLKLEISGMAELESCSESSLAAWLIAKGIRQYKQGDQPDKIPSESPRFDFLVEVTEDDAGL